MLGVELAGWRDDVTRHHGSSLETANLQFYGGCGNRTAVGIGKLALLENVRIGKERFNSAKHVLSSSVQMISAAK